MVILHQNKDTMQENIICMKNHISRSPGQRIIRALILIIVCMALPVNVWAEEEQGTALVSWNDKTGELRFFYYPPGTPYNFPVGLEEKWYRLPEKFESNPIWSGDVLKHVVFKPSFRDYRPKSTAGWFYNCTQLTDIEGLENLNTEDVTDMSYMFFGCKSLTTLDVSSFVTKNVTDMRFMFGQCISLQEIHLDDFYTSNVVNMQCMFVNCNSLKELNVSTFDTRNVTSLSSMFSQCKSLTELDLSSFDTQNAVGMGYMFDHCTNLKTLNLKNFSTRDNTTTLGIFQDCQSLETIYSNNNWSLSKSSIGRQSLMFYNCYSIKGGKGTTYNQYHSDNDYAHIDGGTSNPGYFTELKTNFDYNGGTIPYVELKNNTLTFYYDNKPTTRTGTLYNLKDNQYYYRTDSDKRMPDWFGDRMLVKKAVFDPSFANYRPKKTACWFYLCQNLATIEGMDYLNTENVTDMTGMFRFCGSLTSLDVSRFNTSKVTNMSFMFCYCSKLRNLDVTNFDTSKVTDMQHMFHTCPLEELNLRNFDTSEVLLMPVMFSSCSSLKTIYASEKWTTAKVTTGDYMFYGCRNLVGGMGTIFTPQHIDIEYAHIDGGMVDPGYLTGEYNGTREPYAVLKDSTLTFYYDMNMTCREGTVYPIGEKSNRSWDYSCAIATKTVSFDISFADYRPLQTRNWFGEFIVLTKLENIENLNTSEVTDMSYMFFKCAALPALDLRTFDTRKVKNMFALFYECYSLKKVDVSSFNTSSVTKMGRVFCDCKELPAVDVSNFNTSKVEDMFCMFARCEKLEKLDLSQFDVSNVINMGAMFTECRSLKHLDISRFNTWKVKEYDDLFEACESLVEINVSSFDTRNATSLRRMFIDCNSLERIDISNFFTSNVSTVQNMFTGCRNLQTIYVGHGWSTESIIYSNQMFHGCKNLQGGAGTRFDEAHTDHTYAHIDGGPSNPGYFTYKEYDETKGVEDVQESGRQSEAIYNLQGIRLKEPVKGLYIKNGKKIMAR